MRGCYIIPAAGSHWLLFSPRLLLMSDALIEDVDRQDGGGREGIRSQSIKWCWDIWHFEIWHLTERDGLTACQTERTLIQATPPPLTHCSDFLILIGKIPAITCFCLDLSEFESESSAVFLSTLENQLNFFDSLEPFASRWTWSRKSNEKGHVWM